MTNDKVDIEVCRQLARPDTDQPKKASAMAEKAVLEELQKPTCSSYCIFTTLELWPTGVHRAWEVFE